MLPRCFGLVFISVLRYHSTNRRFLRASNVCSVVVGTGRQLLIAADECLYRELVGAIFTDLSRLFRSVGMAARSTNSTVVRLRLKRRPTEGLVHVLVFVCRWCSTKRIGSRRRRTLQTCQ